MLLTNLPASPPTTEIISWVTQVITAYNGSEERHKIRIKPRSTYESQIPLKTKAEVDQLKSSENKIRDNLQFVVWHAPYIGSARLATIRGHPWYFEFTTPLQVAHYYRDSITISDSLAGNGFIYPVRNAIVDGNLRYSIKRGSGVATIKYNVQLAVEPPSGTFTTQTINGIDYEVLELPTRSGFTQNIIQNQSYFDSVVGAYVGTTRWDRPKLQWSYTVEMFSPNDVLVWKQFLFRRAGRYNPVVIRDTDGRAVIMRMATDVPVINYQQNYATSTVPFIELFV